MSVSVLVSGRSRRFSHAHEARPRARAASADHVARKEFNSPLKLRNAQAIARNVCNASHGCAFRNIPRVVFYSPKTFKCILVNVENKIHVRKNFKNLKEFFTTTFARISIIFTNARLRRRTLATSDFLSSREYLFFRLFKILQIQSQKIGIS